MLSITISVCLSPTAKLLDFWIGSATKAPFIDSSEEIELAASTITGGLISVDCFFFLGIDFREIELLDIVRVFF